MKNLTNLKMHFTIIDETVLPLSSFGQILVETSDEANFKDKVFKNTFHDGKKTKRILFDKM